MRILMLSWEYPPHLVGGLGVHVAELTPALAAEGMEVYVVTPQVRGGDCTERTPAGTHVARIPLPHIESQSFTSFVAQANQELERAAQRLYEQVGGFNLIHTHDWLTAHSAIALKQLWHVPLVATIHATERGRGRGMLHGEQALQIDSLEWQLAYEAWRIIVCSHFMARQVMDTFHAPFDKIDVVPNGTGLRPYPFHTQQERLDFRRRYAADHERIVFYIGRIVYEKGLHVLLDALPHVLHHVETRIVIAGTGPYLDMLKSQASTMCIESHVHFAGFISDEERDQLYHVADVATFPSLYEPFGIVALEAYAAKCPVIVAQTGGLMEVVRRDETGLLVIPGNADSLAAGIVQTFQNLDQTACRVSNAFQDVCDNYNWHHIARQTIATYRRVQQEWKASSWSREVFMSPDEMWRLAG
jgi:glycosyltransferase involved in cell wall biosynthesis